MSGILEKCPKLTLFSCRLRKASKGFSLILFVFFHKFCMYFRIHVLKKATKNVKSRVRILLSVQSKVYKFLQNSSMFKSQPARSSSLPSVSLEYPFFSYHPYFFKKVAS